MLMSEPDLILVLSSQRPGQVGLDDRTPPVDLMLDRQMTVLRIGMPNYGGQRARSC